MSPEELQAIMDADASYKPSGMGAPKGAPSPGELQAIMDSDPSYTPTTQEVEKKARLSGVLDAQTSGFADEIYGFGNAALDQLTGTNKNIPFAQKMDIYSGAMKGAMKDASNEAPGNSLIGNVAGGFLNPVGALIGPTKGVLGAVKAGGLLGGAYGVGSGEGGIPDRAIEGAKGAALGGATSGVISGLGRGLSSLGRWTKGASENIKENVLGAKQSDFTRSAKYRGLRDLDGEPETALKQAFRELSDEGAFDGVTASPSKFIKRGQEVQGKLGSQIEDIVTQADEIRASKDLVIKPQWKEVSKFVESQPVADQEAVRKEAIRLIGAQSKLDGSLRALQSQKVKMNAKVYNENSAISEELDAALTRDIKRTIEEATGVLLPDKAGAIKELNRKWGQYSEVGRILKRSLAEDEAANPFKSILGMVRTSGGGGVGILAGSLLGGPIGAALGAGAGALATTKAGRLATSKAMGAAAPKLGAVGRGLIGAAPRSGLLGAVVGLPKVKETQQEQQPMDSGEPVKPVTARPKTTEIHSMVDKIAGSPELANIAKAVMKVESNGDPRAQSGAGAQGLMQIMPAMQKSLGVKDPFDPEDNIKGGVALLKEEIKRFGGSLELALAAYNAGSPKVKAAIAKAGSMDWDEVSRFLPEETRKYVPKVKQYIEV